MKKDRMVALLQNACEYVANVENEDVLEGLTEVIGFTKDELIEIGVDFFC